MADHWTGAMRQAVAATSVQTQLLPSHANLNHHTRRDHTAPIRLLTIDRPGHHTNLTVLYRRVLMCKLFVLDLLPAAAFYRRNPVARWALLYDIAQLWTGKTSGALRTRHIVGLNRYVGTTAHSNRLRVRMFRAIARPLANRCRLSWRTDL